MTTYTYRNFSFKKLNRCRSPSISQQTNALRTKLFQLQDESIKQHLGTDFTTDFRATMFATDVDGISDNNITSCDSLKSNNLQMLYCTKIKSK